MPGRAAPTEPELRLPAAQRARHHRRRLGQPVALVDRDAGDRRELLDHPRLERRRAGQHQPHRAEPLAQVLVGQPVDEDGRGDRHHAAGLVVDEVEHRLRLELLDEQQPGAVAQHAAEDRVEAVDVEEREHAEDDVVAVHHRRLDGRDLLDVGQQRPVAEHRGARQAGGAAGVEEGGELLGVGQRRHGAYDVRAEGGERDLARPGLGAGDHHGRGGDVAAAPPAHDVRRRRRCRRPRPAGCRSRRSSGRPRRRSSAG